MGSIAKYAIWRGGLLLRTGRDRLDDVQAHHRAKELLRDIGLAVYTHGSDDPEAVTAALAKLDAHLRDHPVDLDTGDSAATSTPPLAPGATEPPTNLPRLLRPTRRPEA